MKLLALILAAINLNLHMLPEPQIIPYKPSCTVYTGTAAGCARECSCRLAGEG